MLLSLIIVCLDHLEIAGDVPGLLRRRGGSFLESTDWVQREGQANAARRMAQQGIGFHIAALRALEGRADRNGEVEWLPIPAVTNLAFACELYLKSLLFFEKGTTTREYRLSVIFSQLSDDVQQDAATHFGAGDLRGRLAEFSNAFVEWRYIFEQLSASLNNRELLDVAGTLLDVVTKHIGLGADYARKIKAQRDWSRI